MRTRRPPSSTWLFRGTATVSVEGMVILLLEESRAAGPTTKEVEACMWRGEVLHRQM